MVVALAATMSMVAAAPLAADAGEAATGRTVLHYGDSLAVGTAIFLPRFLSGWSLQQSYDVSRHADEAPADLPAFGPALPRVIVVSLGANDAPAARAWFSRQVRAVVRVAGPQRCVIWSTVLRPPYEGVSYDGFNNILRRLARRSRSLHVFDWVALARAHPQWLGPDGVHPTMTGYRTRAVAIAKLVKSC